MWRNGRYMHRSRLRLRQPQPASKGGNMAKNLATKILEAHLVEGELIPGKEIAIKVDHTLLQDATGTMAILEFMAMGAERVKVELAAQYIDHNLLQTDSKNADDHV